MEGAGSIAEEGRGRAGAVPPSLEPVPGKIHFYVHPRRRPGCFIYILALQRKGTKRPGMALPWVAGGWKKSALPGWIQLCARQKDAERERFPELPWLSPCFPVP